MKILRGIATILLYGPVLGMLGTVYGVMSAFGEMHGANSPIEPGQIARHIEVAVFATILALVMFPLGLISHGIIASRTQLYDRMVWRRSVGASILLCLTNPFGLFLGIPALLAIFNMQTFKRMRKPNN